MNTQHIAQRIRELVEAFPSMTSAAVSNTLLDIATTLEQSDEMPSVGRNPSTEYVKHADKDGAYHVELGPGGGGGRYVKQLYQPHPKCGGYYVTAGGSSLSNTTHYRCANGHWWSIDAGGGDGGGGAREGKGGRTPPFKYDGTKAEFKVPSPPKMVGVYLNGKKIFELPEGSTILCSGGKPKEPG